MSKYYVARYYFNGIFLRNFYLIALFNILIGILKTNSIVFQIELCFVNSTNKSIFLYGCN